MTQHNTLNVKLSNSHFNKSKSAIKNGTEVTLNLSPNIIGDSNDKNNFRYKFLLTNTQVSKLCRAFANNFSANTKLSKTQLHKIKQSGGLLARPLGPLLKAGLPLVGNILISNKGKEDMKKVTSLEDSSLLIKCASETIKNEAKEQKEDFSECYLEL